MATWTHYFPTTSDRVSKHTSDASNARILTEMENRIARCAGDTRRISERLRELSYEWDIERALELWAGGVGLTGLVLGTTVHRRWFALSAIAGTFISLLSLIGWCPPVVGFRRMGFRTHREIESERTALKALRGDFVGCELEGVTSKNALRAADPTFYKHGGGARRESIYPTA